MTTDNSTENESTQTNGGLFTNKYTSSPYAYIIYIFLNGEGMKCQHINFTPSQLEKGIKHVLELISRIYNVKGSKLVTMDGTPVHKVSDLMSRGAYVLIPFGQSSLREAWYFLPDNAIDTGENSEVWSRKQRTRRMQK